MAKAGQGLEQLTCGSHGWGLSLIHVGSLGQRPLADGWGCVEMGHAWPEVVVHLAPAREAEEDRRALATSSGATDRLRRGYGHRRDRGEAPHPARLGTDAEKDRSDEGADSGGDASGGI